ncbi:uncharacterized protein [Branchiostoma lanceolatum]|uniref:uncharacterized protein n=1 Tax=Branchiostoma lanceolatum TaxID=7740 RepID=UPI0034525D4C
MSKMTSLFALTLAVTLLTGGVHAGPLLPEFQHLLTDAVDGSYTISERCNADLKLSECRLNITSDPDPCLTVRPLLSTVLPNLPLNDYSSGVASDLLDLPVSGSYVDGCDKEFSVSGGTTKPVTIVPSVVTLDDLSVSATFTLPSSFNALFSGVWPIGDVDFTVTLEKSEDGFLLKGKAVEVTGLTTKRLISGFSSFVPGNVVRDAFHLLKLDSVAVEYTNVEVTIGDSGYSLKLDFDTNFLNSQIFVFLSSAESDDRTSSGKWFSVGMSVRSVRFGDLIHDVIGDNVDIPIMSDLVLPEAALLALPKITELELDYPVPLLNEAASGLEEMEGAGGVGIAFTLKLSDEAPFGTFFLGLDEDNYKFKVLSDEPIPVSALLDNVISSFSSMSVKLPPQLRVTDILTGSLKSFEYNKDTNTMTVTAAVGNSLVLIPNVLVLEDIAARFQLEQGSSPRNGDDFTFALDSVWTFGQFSVPLSVAKDTKTQGFSASGSVEADIPVGALMQQFGTSFLPTGELRGILHDIGLGTFVIEDPGVAVMFGKGKELSAHLEGSAAINDWSCTVELVVDRVKNNLVMAAGVTLSRTGIVPAVSTLTGGKLDISVIPGASILSHTDVAFVVSPSKMPRDIHWTSSVLADVDIEQGINIVASVTLPPNCGRDVFCKVVKKLLGADIELKLLATLTSASDLSLKAVVGTPVTLADGFEMQDVGFEIEVGKTNNAIGITGTLEFEDPPIVLRGGVGASQSGGYLSMSMEGMWNRAFGLDFLAIGDINFELTMTPEPTAIASLELGGRAIIGYQNNPSATPIEASVDIGVNKVDPRQNYCAGSVSALTISAILKAFGHSLPLPSFLKDTGFPKGASFSYSKLQRTLPNGKTIQQGFFFSGIVQILFFKVQTDIRIDSTSLYSKMTVTPFEIGGGLISVSGSDGKKGPTLLVDIPFAPRRAEHELLIDGSITVLGIKRSARITMTKSKTSFAIEGKFLNKFSASLELETSYGSLKDAEFIAKGTFKNDLFSSLCNEVENTLDNYVKDANKAINDAKRTVTKAYKACDDARKPFKEAQADVNGAQRDFDNAVGKLRRARQSVEGEKRKFDNAEADLTRQQRKCRYKSCSWYDVPCHAHNAGMAICQAALEIAKQTVKATKYTLDVAKLAVRGAQEIVDNSRWTLDVAKGVLEGTKVAVHETCDLGIDIARGTLDAARETNKFGVQVAEKTAQGVLGGVVDIREMGFRVKVAAAQTGSFDGWMKVSFFKKTPQTMNIKIKIFSIEEMAGYILDLIEDLLDV